jgi:4-hydroxybenzoate adenylyltransferase
MTLEHIDTRPRTAPSSNIAVDLAERAERHGWATAPAFYVDGRVWTHGEVHDLAARAAMVLVEHGLRPGERVLVALPDSIGWVATFLAAARIGAVAVLSNPDLPAADHEFIVADSDPVLCVTGAALEDRFHPARWLDIERLMARALVAAPTHEQRVGLRSPLYIQYTSGTTGEPKGVVHDHGHPPIYHDAVGRQVLGIRPTDVALSTSKLYFAYGFGNALVFPLYSGSSAVLLGERPTAERVAESVARHRVTMLYAVPSAYAALVAGGDPAAFSTLRGAVSAGETLAPTLAGKAADLLGAPVYEQIGSTEVGHAFCANGVDHNVPGTLGRPVPGYQLALRDRHGNEVGDGDRGELWVRGPTLMRGYLNRRTETAATLVDGWLATRDLAERDADGCYRHLGRVDDMEMVGGITVSPVEVERVLSGHPLVGEVAVAAIPDGTGATKLRAFVVPAGPAVDPTVLESALLCLARERLAAFKVPRTVHLVPALPRTATGKVRRHIVRAGTW